MVTYKALGAFSPILLYGFYDKVPMPYKVKSSEVDDSEKIQKGLDIKFHEESKMNEHILNNGLIQIMKVNEKHFNSVQNYQPPVFCKVPQFSLVLGLALQSRFGRVSFERAHINCDVKGAYTLGKNCNVIVIDFYKPSTQEHTLL